MLVAFAVAHAAERHGFGLRTNDPKPAGKWIERFEEWLADSGFFEKNLNQSVLIFQIGISTKRNAAAHLLSVQGSNLEP